MKHKRSSDNLEKINSKEIELVKKVLNVYNIKFLTFKKVRSVYKIKTSNGNLCLKRFKHGKSKAEKGNILVEELYKNNFINVPKYIRTKNNNLLVKHKNLFFYVTEWIDGTETNLDDINEAVNCAKLLANFHLATRNINLNKIKIKNNLGNWPNIYKNKLYDFNKYQKIIDNKIIKNEFDYLYKKNIDIFYNKGLISLKIINNSDYYKLSHKSNHKYAICHDSFYYQNIIKKNDKYYIIDLDSIIVDLPVSDLGKFIRRLMNKKYYAWDFNKALKIVEGYCSVNLLSKSELEIMLALIMFPHKFWKIGKKRYIKHKHWSEYKYTNKLNKILKKSIIEGKFFDDCISYIKKI